MLSPGSPPDGEYDASPAELPITPHSEHHSRSRTSSFSSITSDASMFAPVSFSQRQYVLPSDAESCSEVCIRGHPELSSFSKEGEGQWPPYAFLNVDYDALHKGVVKNQHFQSRPTLLGGRRGSQKIVL